MRAEFGVTSRESDATKNQALTDMVNRIFAVIEFDKSGTILNANPVFLEAMGYTMNEIVGAHHRMFVDRAYAQSHDYEQFWQDLAAGIVRQGQFARLTKAGKTIWIQASYAPVFDDLGNVTSVIKVASDVTPRRTVVNEVAAGLEALKQGNLEYRVHVAPDNELYSLAEGYNASMNRLVDLFDVVGQVADGLGKSACEVRKRADHSADTALRNAASFEETSAEVEMVAQSVSSTSENAAAALDRTQETARIVDVGAETMAHALDATVEMRQSTKEMSGINEVIDSIAFQTNLLALNAGIEAARAGQSGAGFAVVATEIRSLAARSQDASSKIQALIARSVEQAKSTETYVHEGESNLKDVQGKSRGVAENMIQISEESREQAKRVDVINKVVRDLAITSERDAQSASENQDSAETLTQFSDRLLQELRDFGVTA